MSGFLLDTNVLSELKRRMVPDPPVSAWLRATDPDLLWASVFMARESSVVLPKLLINLHQQNRLTRTTIARELAFPLSELNYLLYWADDFGR